jgi:thiamine transport system ATP-binding protein
MLDEPLGALDRSLRDRLVVELKAILRTIGISALAITHDHAEAFAFADRVIVMAEDGRVAQTGTPAEVWQHPASAAVARFLGFSNVVDEADGTAVLIRPRAVIADPSGPLTGTMIDRTFAGDGIDVVLAIAGRPPLTARWPATTTASIGDTVRVRIDPTGVVRLASPGMENEDDRVQSRADLLPEEERAGSDDPEAQAEAILEDSDARTEDLDAAPGTYVEHRTSEDTVEPPG